MNGITKEAFLKAEDPKTRDEMLYDMLEGIYKQVNFKRTLIVAFLGAIIAVTIMESPSLLAMIRLIG